MSGFFIRSGICAFLVGVLLQMNIHLDLKVIFVTFFYAMMIAVKNKKFAFIILCLSFGLLRAYFDIPNFDEKSIHFYQNENLNQKLMGVVADFPDRRREKANYTIDVEKLLVGQSWENVEGKILISFELYPEYKFGDRLEITGLLIEPTEFEGFSYKNYLSLESVYSVMYKPQIKKLNSGAFSFFGMIFTLKEAFESRINRILPEPSASFAAGLLTGSRKGIHENIMEAFNLTGLTHIIAISGYNISLIIIFISSLLKSTNKKFKIILTIALIVMFTIFVGASAAVVRASIMGIIGVLALWYGRKSEVIHALFLSAFFMVLINPRTLVYDVGFQLSFLATLGLILTGNKIIRICSFLPEILGIREAFAMTLSAQIFALPVIVYNFGRLSIISPVANILVVPLIPLAMVFSFISTVLSFINFNIGFILRFPAYIILEFIIKIAQVLSAVPLASFEISWFNFYFLIGYYFLFMSAYFINKNFRKVFLRA